MPEVAQQTPLPTLVEAAATVRLAPKTLTRAIRKGELLGLKFGGRWRIRETDLDAWVESRRFVSVDAPESGAVKPAAPVETGSLEALRRIEAA